MQQPAEQVELLTEQYAHIAANYKTLAELLAHAGLTRIQQHIEKMRESYGPSR